MKESHLWFFLCYSASFPKPFPNLSQKSQYHLLISDFLVPLNLKHHLSLFSTLILYVSDLPLPLLTLFSWPYSKRNSISFIVVVGKSNLVLILWLWLLLWLFAEDRNFQRLVVSVDKSQISGTSATIGKILGVKQEM